MFRTFLISLALRVGLRVAEGAGLLLSTLFLFDLTFIGGYYRIILFPKRFPFFMLFSNFFIVFHN